MRQGSTAQHGRCAEVLTVSHYGEQHTHHAEVMTGSNPEASHSTSRHLWLLAVESLQSGDRMRTRSRPVRCRPVVGAVVASLAETHAEAPADVQLRGPALGRRPWMRSGPACLSGPFSVRGEGESASSRSSRLWSLTHGRRHPPRFGGSSLSSLAADISPWAAGGGESPVRWHVTVRNSLTETACPVPGSGGRLSGFPRSPGISHLPVRKPPTASRRIRLTPRGDDCLHRPPVGQSPLPGCRTFEALSVSRARRCADATPCVFPAFEAGRRRPWKNSPLPAVT
jgi:hypothetical protein